MSMPLMDYVQNVDRQDIAGLACTFVGGAASTYFFRRPSFDNAGFKVLALGGLQGTVATVAATSLALLLAIAIYKPSQNDKDADDDAASRKGTLAFNALYGVTACVVVPVAAKFFPSLLGTPMEAFVNFALSSALALLPATLMPRQPTK